MEGACACCCSATKHQSQQLFAALSRLQQLDNGGCSGQPLQTWAQLPIRLPTSRYYCLAGCGIPANNSFHTLLMVLSACSYEAWIIYNFSSLLLAYVGGPGAVVVKAEGKLVHPSWSRMTCCLPTMQVDGFFLRRCKQGTLQFVLLKPIMALLTVILYAAGAYTDGDMSVNNG
jgi:hypothetical protein